MPVSGFKRHVYNRYRVVILLLIFAIATVASTVSYFWYQNALENALSTESIAFIESAKLLDEAFHNEDDTSIENHLPLPTHSSQVISIVDENLNIVATTAVLDKTTNRSVKLTDIVPTKINEFLIRFPIDGVVNARLYGWLLQATPIHIHEWKLVKYQKSRSIEKPILVRAMTIFCLVFLMQFALLAAMYFITRKIYIVPIKALVGHIEKCAVGDISAVKPIKGWSQWFQLIETTFEQNRQILHQLKEKNIQLDSEVSEKTEALLAKGELHQRDFSLLNSVMSAFPEFIVFNDLNHLIMGCNKSFLEFVNRNESEVIGEDISSYFPESLAKIINQKHEQFSQNLSGEENTITDTVETADGVYEVFSAQFYNEEGAAYGSIDIIRNVTNEHTAQSVLAEAKLSAEDANKAKSQFLANMSHEIRTPLNAIHGLVSLLSSTSLSLVQQNYLKNVETASNSLLHLVDDLLNFTKIESGNLVLAREQCSLRAIVKQAVNLNIAQAVTKNVGLTVEVDSVLPDIVISDELRLVQVLSNLINNAVKFTDTGTVNLVISSLGISSDNALIKFEVIDSGIGIDKKDQSNLFDVFKQADDSMTRKYGGSGLGLAICRQIINLMGGDISIKSELGMGSTFSFVIGLRTAESKEKNMLEKANIFCCINTLPKGLEAEFRKLNTQLNEVSNINEFCENKTKDLIETSSNNVIIIDEEKLLNSNLESFINLVKDSVSLVSVIHPPMTNIRHSLVEEFDKNKIVYQLLDRSLLTISIDEINRALIENNTTPVSTQNSQDLSELRVLVVEDNKVNQLVAKELLMSLNASEVLIAENGKIALEVLEKETVDVVLMDIQMPVMDGLTATRTLRKDSRFKLLPIIAMTAHVGESDKKRSYEAGINAHLGKPVKAEVMKNTILSVL